MDDEMIETVAKALWDDDQAKLSVRYGLSNELIFGKIDGSIVLWDDLFPFFAEEWRSKAKIAIKAMREPTEKMIRAVPLDCHAHSTIYNKMIDAIINE